MDSLAYVFVVDGKLVSLSPEYTLSFYSDRGTLMPVLYRNGKRLTKEWSVCLHGSRADDSEHANANTE